MDFVLENVIQEEEKKSKKKQEKGTLGKLTPLKQQGMAYVVSHSLTRRHRISKDLAVIGTHSTFVEVDDQGSNQSCAHVSLGCEDQAG